MAQTDGGNQRQNNNPLPGDGANNQTRPGKTRNAGMSGLSGTAGQSALYKIYGTNEPYNGLTVEVGGFLYSTMGGALEGDSYQLMANSPQADPNKKLITPTNPQSSQIPPISSTRPGGGNQNTTPGGPRNDKINQGGSSY
jgi:hypothetical protein